LFAVIMGCSSSNFEVSEGTDAATAEDTGVATDTRTGGGEDADPLPSDGNTVDSGGTVTEAGAACPAETNPAVIWVDAESTATSPTGTSTCPFRHVLDAVNYANSIDTTTPRQIRVRNGIYTESAAIILRKGLTLTGNGVGLTQLQGGGPCTSSTTGYKCVVRVDGGAVLERVSVDAAPNGRHGVVTGEPMGSSPIVRSTVVTNAGGSCCAGILVSAGGAQLGPNIAANNNAYGLVLWGSIGSKIVLGTNKFEGNSIVGINQEGTGQLVFEGGSVSKNLAGIKLGDTATTLPPNHKITGLTAIGNVEYGIRVTGVASATIRNSTITGSKFGIIAIHGASNFIDVGNGGSSGNNNFGSATNKNSLGAICAMFTRSPPFDATGNTFPYCTAPKSLADIATEGGCEIVTAYSDVWYRGGTLPITAGCTVGM
jgi:hypothetical protein